MPQIIAIVIVLSGVLIWFGNARYRRDLRAARSRLEDMQRRVTQLGALSVEYTDMGTGPCLLVSHGIFHGCDGGQRSARDVVSGHRVIAPSRFGYLGSDMPEGANGAAQADAFVALLDSLDVEDFDVLGISAGTSAAVQLALRHPERVKHLVISSGNWPGSPTSMAPPAWAKMFYNDPAMWVLRAMAPPFVAGLMGIPKGFPQDEEQARYVEEMLDSIFPVEPRAKGAIFDAFSSNPEINEYRLQELEVPTMIIHSKDDPLASYEAALEASGRIQDAVFVSLGSGGHLGLGQTETVRDAIGDLLTADVEKSIPVARDS